MYKIFRKFSGNTNLLYLLNFILVKLCHNFVRYIWTFPPIFFDSLGYVERISVGMVFTTITISLDIISERHNNAVSYRIFLESLP